MILSFADQGTEDLFDGNDTKAARKTCPQAIWSVARRKLDAVNNAEAVTDLRIPLGNYLEKLHGDRKGQWSIRINDQYRVCLRWEGVDAHDVEIVDYH